MGEKRERGFWRVIGVAVLFAAGSNLLSFAFLAESLLTTVLLGAVGTFLVGSAVYDAKTGRVLSRKEKYQRGFFPSGGKKLASIVPTAKRSIEALAGLVASVCRSVPSLLKSSEPGKRRLSPRQRKVRFEDVLAHPIKKVKERVKNERVDFRALLETEKRNRDREELEAWLREEIGSGGGEAGA